MTRYRLLTLLFLMAAQSSLGAQTLTYPDPTNGFGEVKWGTGLKDFRAAKGSKITYSVDRPNARALDYLLMDFHEVDKEDPARAPEFQPQTIAGDQALYVFYRQKFCGASLPVTLSDTVNFEKALSAKFKCQGITYYTVHDVFYGRLGSERAVFHYYRYQAGPTTRLYLVEVTTFYEDPGYCGKTGYDVVETHGGDLTWTYLIYVSEDYLQGPNAYSDWQENRKNPDLPKLSFLEQIKCSIEH